MSKNKDNLEKNKSPQDPRWNYSIGIACIILGIMIALLFKSYRTEGDSSIYGQRKDLAEMVKYLKTEHDRLKTDLENARATIDRYETAAAKGDKESSVMMNHMQILREQAGITDLKGPGIIVVLTDSPNKPKAGDDPNNYIVHDIDLIALVNELWASGAEAISINGERLVVNSAIRCVGPTITVNTVRLSQPYEVKAIGPPENLETGLRYTGGFMDSMSPNIDRGVGIKIVRDESVIIPAYTGSLSHKYAKIYKNKKDEKSK